MPRCFYQKYQKCPCHIIHSSTSHRCKLEQTVWRCQIIIFLKKKSLPCVLRFPKYQSFFLFSLPLSPHLSFSVHLRYCLLTAPLRCLRCRRLCYPAPCLRFTALFIACLFFLSSSIWSSYFSSSQFFFFFVFIVLVPAFAVVDLQVLPQPSSLLSTRFCFTRVCFLNPKLPSPSLLSEVKCLKVQSFCINFVGISGLLLLCCCNV